MRSCILTRTEYPEKALQTLREFARFLQRLQILDVMK